MKSYLLCLTFLWSAYIIIERPYARDILFPIYESNFISHKIHIATVYKIEKTLIHVGKSNNTIAKALLYHTQEHQPLLYLPFNLIE